MMNHALAGRNLSFAYVPGAPVLSEVSVQVCGGAVTGIVGPNGSGKSTLLRLLAGLTRPQSGSVDLDDAPLRNLSARHRARVIAFLPQAVQPIFSLRVFEVVALGRHPHVGVMGALTSRDRDIVAHCMAQTETTELRNREFVTLSGGERQRVLIASILAQEPQILLLDEPTSALDIHHQVEIFALLRRLSREGYGVGVVTHDLNLAARFCDRVLLLTTTAGAAVAQGPPAEVFTEAILRQAYPGDIQVTAHPVTGSPLITVIERRAS